MVIFSFHSLTNDLHIVDLMFGDTQVIESPLCTFLSSEFDDPLHDPDLIEEVFYNQTVSCSLYSC